MKTLQIASKLAVAALLAFSGGLITTLAQDAPDPRRPDNDARPRRPERVERPDRERDREEERSSRPDREEGDRPPGHDRGFHQDQGRDFRPGPDREGRPNVRRFDHGPGLPHCPTCTCFENFGGPRFDRPLPFRPPGMRLRMHRWMERFGPEFGPPGQFQGPARRGWRAPEFRGQPGPWNEDERDSDFEPPPRRAPRGLHSDQDRREGPPAERREREESRLERRPPPPREGGRLREEGPRREEDGQSDDRRDDRHEDQRDNR